MSTEVSVSDVNELCAVRDPGIHVNETQEVQAQRRSETTKKHADKKQRVIVCVMIWRDVVNIKKLEKLENLHLPEITFI